jgi:cyclic pyranopterin monophosphate synthase
MSNKLTHIDPHGNAHMVNISEKKATIRRAIASGKVVMNDETLSAITEQRIKKGDVLSIAQLAGIMGTKRTADLIPLCHPIPIDGVDVELILEENGVLITATVHTTWKTGVEMEALTAVSASALTLYDMIKSIDKGVRITDIQLLEKTGGKSGDWKRNREL